MIIYFAGIAGELKQFALDRDIARLYSYAIARKDAEEYARLEVDKKPPLLVDSGAFSAYNSGKEVKLDDYINWINNNDKADWYISLDSIPKNKSHQKDVEESAQISWENYLYIISKVKDPYKILPVYHFGENISNLKRILEYKIDGKPIPYICINYKMGMGTDNAIKYLTMITNVIKNSPNPNVKVHILGMTVYEILVQFDFYSCDSTTYRKKSGYGLIQTSYGDINISSRNYKMQNFSYMHKEAQDKIKAEVKSLGYDIEELKVSDLARAKYNIDFQVYYWNKLKKQYQEMNESLKKRIKVKKLI